MLIAERARFVTNDQRGREVILATMLPGDYVGEMSLVDGELYSAAVHAEVQTNVLALGRLRSARCHCESNCVAYAVMREVVQRLRQTDRNIKSLMLVNLYGRVDHAHLKSSCKDHHGDVVISEKISQQSLASTVGVLR